MSVTHRCLVRGKVQGVFFRASTKQQADRLGISGYAKNLADGRVEVLMQGAPEDVARLQAWLWQGPPSSDVTEVTCEDAGRVSAIGFRTL